MLKEWRKFRGWVVLEYFLQNPYSRIHIKGLAKSLGISPRTAEVYCKLYEKAKLLKLEKVANTLQFSLDNSDHLARELKRFWFLSFLRERNFVDGVLEKNSDIISLALYGAYASGNYSNESDVDILAISQGKKVDLEPFRALEAGLGRAVEVSVYSVGEWRSAKRKKNEFAASVLKNNVLLWGSEI